MPRNSDAPAGQVLETNPPSGQQVPIGSKVTLFVSNAQVKVPDVVGKDLVTAEGLLQQAGFTVVERPAPVYDRRVAEDIVVSQTPSGNTFATTGSDNPVTIYYNQKPTPTPTPSSTSASPSPTPTSPSPTPSP